MNKDAAYWMALAHLPNWGQKRNNLIIKFFSENKISIEDFFQLSEDQWQNDYGLGLKELEDLKQAKSDLGNLAFQAESLYDQGYEIIPITSTNYSKTLKENLKTSSPTLLYIKGNKKILNEKSIAIVGSRTASDLSLQFTDNIAKLASKEYKVVVSGFAKGVDKQALDSAIKYKGHSVIVLPQGITTFVWGFKAYYKQIIDGDVLVLSTFLPQLPWEAGLAMARNSIIYGLADEIYVAESSDKGGTWSGANDGLKKKRKVYVRKPEPTENNANQLLIQKGAIPVDFDGNVIESEIHEKAISLISVTTEPEINYESKILDLLSTGDYAIKDIIKRLKLDWKEKKLKDFLTTLTDIEKIQKKPIRFTLKNRKQQQLKLFE